MALGAPLRSPLPGVDAGSLTAQADVGLPGSCQGPASVEGRPGAGLAMLPPPGSSGVAVLGAVLRGTQMARPNSCSQTSHTPLPRRWALQCLGSLHGKNPHPAPGACAVYSDICSLGKGDAQTSQGQQTQHLCCPAVQGHECPRGSRVRGT